MLAIFLDIETTGLDSFQHSPIDLALKVINLTNGKEKGTYQSVIKHPREIWEKKDPVSVLINGYTWEVISQGKCLSQVREEIITLFKQLQIIRGKAVFICQNPAFDRNFFSHIVDVYTQEKLNWPYHWLDFASMYWTHLIKRINDEHLTFPESLNLSKNEIARQYGLQAESTPHLAMNGVNHLIECYKAVHKIWVIDV